MENYSRLDDIRQKLVQGFKQAFPNDYEALAWSWDTVFYLIEMLETVTEIVEEARFAIRELDEGDADLGTSPFTV